MRTGHAALSAFLVHALWVLPLLVMNPASLQAEEVVELEEPVIIYQPLRVELPVTNAAEGFSIVESVKASSRTVQIERAPESMAPGEAAVLAIIVEPETIGAFEHIVEMLLVSESGSSTEQWRVRGQSVPPSADWFIAPEVLAAAPDDFVLWDFRAADIYQRFHIRGARLVRSINYGRATREKKPIVLLTDTHPEPAAIRFLLKLDSERKGGAFFLRGGMTGWMQRGFEAVGTAPLDRASTMVSAERLIELEAFSPIVWSHLDQQVDSSLLPLSIEIRPWGPDSEKHVAQSAPNVHRPQFHLFADDATAFAWLEQLNPATAAPTPVVKGGWPALVRFVNERERLRIALQESIKGSPVQNGPYSGNFSSPGRDCGCP